MRRKSIQFCGYFIFLVFNHLRYFFYVNGVTIFVYLFDGAVRKLMVEIIHFLLYALNVSSDMGYYVPNF